MNRLLEVTGLHITATAPDGRSVPLVEDITLGISAGERVALVGESGSGKSVTARALLRLDDSVRLTGSIRLDGRELLGLPERDLTRLRGSSVALVTQDPLAALNPLMTVGDQVAEPLLVRSVARKEARRRAVAMLDELGVADAARRSRAYPHEFSGGMRQRVALAMALVCEPALLLADEPTTALDVRVQQQVMDLLTTVSRERGLAVLLITHDVGVVAGFADRVEVLYSGRVVESAPVRTLFEAPVHPYTRALLGAVPRIGAHRDRLTALPGTPPDPSARPGGCVFHPRCPVAEDACRTTRPTLAPPTGAHRAACPVTAPARPAQGAPA
ncbi:putative ABC transporter ATP-binding protein [Actinacidiphila reveromycinica]|uniref:Putative ABC transporter ATP-binding protein n=1 Tax=Actinacidiphila reveromycinica TaxID=659352 RepID=A0A7U3UXY3_9ACTN|nr:ABC transporter ATP-binding protein [Streptomyces sp. SN-593]BBB02316.1 putative ABC transporter ATP-binding protein [Streptomyces sp. SN-593]